MGKGDSFERELCRYISLWWTEGKDPDVFWRNPTRKTKKGKGKHQLGDLKADKTVGEPLISLFNIEFKSGYSVNKSRKGVRNVPWDLLELIDYSENQKDLSKKTLMRFWNQCCEDSRISGRKPLLIFKRDYHQPVVCIEDEVLCLLEQYNGSFLFSHLTFVIPEERRTTVLIFIRKDVFFEWLNPESVKALYSDRENKD